MGAEHLPAPDLDDTAPCSSRGHRPRLGNTRPPADSRPASGSRSQTASRRLAMGGRVSAVGCKLAAVGRLRRRLLARPLTRRLASGSRSQRPLSGGGRSGSGWRPTRGCWLCLPICLACWLIPASGEWFSVAAAGCRRGRRAGFGCWRPTCRCWPCPQNCSGPSADVGAPQAGPVAPARCRPAVGGQVPAAGGHLAAAGRARRSATGLQADSGA